MRPALERFGDEPIGSLKVDQLAAWRASLPPGKRYRSHRALRQVLQAAVRWKWIEDNAAVLVKNPVPKPGEIHPFDSWEELDAIANELDDVAGPLVDLLCGDGRSPGGGFRRRVARRRPRAPRAHGASGVREGAPEGLREDERVSPSRAAARSGQSLRSSASPTERGILFPAAQGGRIEINNFRHRQWTPALAAAGIDHRRIYDLRHTYASWSLAAGVDIFTLARRMGTSVKMIDRRTDTSSRARTSTSASSSTPSIRAVPGPFGRYLDTKEAADAA